MTRPNFTEIVFIIDRSGSMQSIASDMEGAFSTFIEDQRKVPGECVVTLVQFSDEHQTVYSERPIAEVQPLEIRPDGMTALLDAIGFTIDAVGKRLASRDESERPSSVIVVIVTDGQENHSQHFKNRADIHAKITTQRESYGWSFVFLAANQDAIAVGSTLGVSQASSVTFSADPVGTRALIGGLSASVTASRATRGPVAYSQADYAAQVAASNPVQAIKR